MADDRLSGLTKIALKKLAAAYDLPEEAVVPEFFDFLKIVSNGAKKYAMNNWLEPNGMSVTKVEMHDKMFHHLARSFSHRSRLDADSGEDHLLHLVCRALMYYTRLRRGIKHDKD